MVDIIIINNDFKCVSLTIWKMLPTEGGIPIPEILQAIPENKSSTKMSLAEYKNSNIQDNTIFLHSNRVKNLVERESKGIPDNEKVVIVKAGTAWLGKIINSEDIITI